jgi:uncharacterized membrane protein YkvA (DUF1232 family)
MVLINDATLIDITFSNCRFTLVQLSKFAEYVDTHANQFEAVRFFINNNATIDTDNNTSTVYNKQYTGLLQITQEHSFNEKSIYNIIQLFSGIKSLGLTIFQPKTDEYTQEAIAYSTELTNLTTLSFKVNTETNEKEEVSNRFWNYINKILQHCPVVNTVYIGLVNATIEEIIDLQFLSIKHCITVTIKEAIFNDNQLNMISINDATLIDIIFQNCRFTLARLKKFAEYVDTHTNQFEAVRFFIDNDTIIETSNDTITVYNKQYTGILEITQLHLCNEKSIHNIIQLFSGIKFLALGIFQPKTDEYIQGAIAYSTELTNLTTLELRVETATNEKVEVGNRYWNYINKILQQCPKVNDVVLWFDNATIEEPIDLQFLPIEHCITVTIQSAIFNENQLNMVLINDATLIDIRFYNCRFTLLQLSKFAEYVDANANRFKAVRFFIDNYDKIDSDNNTITIYKQYTGILQITQLHWFNETSINNIIQLFSGIKTFYLVIFQPKTDEDIQEAIAYSTELTNLIMLEVTLETETNEKVEVSKRYWNYINKILQQCPVVNKVHLRFDNATIEVPIDLKFLSIKHCITVAIHNAKFNDNQLNMISIADAKRITILFSKCQFTLIRLIQFAQYVDENVEKFEQIDFAHVINQVDIDEYTQNFKNIIIRRRLPTGFSIIKRCQSGV